MGISNPETVADQAETADVARLVCTTTPEQAAILKVIYRRAGVKQRHIALTSARIRELHAEAGADLPLKLSTAERMGLYRRYAGPLSVRASRDALAEARVAPGDISHLVTVSCTGFAAPGVDIGLMTELGLRPTVERTHVGFMSCHGAMNGLRVARAIAEADSSACVLLSAVELCTLHYCFGWDPERIIGNSIFADGAASVVGRASHAGEEWQAAANGSCLIPDSLSGIGWNVGDQGFEISLSAKVPELIKGELKAWMEEWLRPHGLPVDKIASWAVHPGGPRILTAVEESLGLSREATGVSREILAEYGNMSSPTVLFIVQRLKQRGAALPCVALAFGPGLTAEAVLFL